MDTTDRRILRVLQQDARITMTALAEQISMSVPATAERVHRLEEQQIIRGYHADISAVAAGYEIEAVVLATAHAGSIDEFRRRPIYRPVLEAGIFDTFIMLRKDKSFQEERIPV